MPPEWDHHSIEKAYNIFGREQRHARADQEPDAAPAPVTSFDVGLACFAPVGAMVNSQGRSALVLTNIFRARVPSHLRHIAVFSEGSKCAI